ncbi:substance-K receptor-like [Mya arenaria]|uniref:substance-K receptor-like n=1 Tax=Mya arenaria TaxID=6604 RepID=UPI0022E2EA5B|nr:substance-K receptor-like [Mya arenaria]XP_052789675.1 substance-K receptor-like [Mya arenaria]XP_052789676.1 substance-K receptor-like [Mya arenaria]XP_052789677.1 substance-K receptor-like [Mya arenaria]XP_052789678.1 substance-K receptor-like [Mya arenaria]XP_052789679.1 substance-K receptor-like [Mya arenaria]
MGTSIIVEIVFLVFMIILTLTTNVITLLVIACTDYLRNINKVYLYSVTISDLCIGVFIFPFALYSAVINLYGTPEIDPKLCHIQAYLTVVLFLSGLYAIAWMNVDHYVAVRKPERYKVMMSPPRSLCWIAFAWIAAISFCCPPVLSYSEIDQYYTEVYLCAVNFGSEIPYFISAAILALLPAFLVLIITNVYLFTHGFRKKQKMYEAVLLDVSSRPRNYQINFIVSSIYAGTWLPWCITRIISYYVIIPDLIHFLTFWAAMGNGFYKFFVYITMSLEYRRGLQELVRMCCKVRRCCCCKPENRNPRQITAPANPTLAATRILTKPSTSGPPPANV